MSAILEQMAEHGVDFKKYPVASFCYGRGWRGHKTVSAAEAAARKDARRFEAQFGGTWDWYVADTATGKTVEWAGRTCTQ